MTPADPTKNRKLKIRGRELAVPESMAKTKIVKFEFDELCGKPLSAADYLEVTKTFKTIFVVDA
ncbi:hypothetical protein CPB83DRAFT_855212 [Crepidotus variabilis]|uniref:Uncharacterized protein n=1 Tax=Crepidotus variabilis TaxID=179855 RepID=A0A9P6JPC3_9AGAR|nr:hypothetical protein CPB83DRAFT_855212 [Crepidotus variabilis]